MIEDGIMDIKTFLKYAPLGLRVRTDRADDILHYDKSKSYPWRYGDQPILKAWWVFQFTPEESATLIPWNKNANIISSFSTILEVVQQPKCIINFNHIGGN